MKSPIFDIIMNSPETSYNSTYRRRLKSNMEALLMEFWYSHFELNSLNEYPEIHGKILDFGCGSGHLDLLLARKGKTIHGIDLSEAGIGIANYLREQESLETQSRCTFSLTDIHTEPTEKFDSMWSTQVFEHIVDPSVILDSCKKWLCDGAHVLISVPWKKYYDHVHHFNDTNQLRKHLEPHINVVRVSLDVKNKVIRALCKI